MHAKKYAIKPGCIYAMQFLGWNWAACEDFIAGEPLMHPQWVKDYDELRVNEQLVAKRNDYIIKDDKGNLSVMPLELFEKTFVEVK